MSACGRLRSPTWPRLRSPMTISGEIFKTLDEGGDVCEYRQAQGCRSSFILGITLLINKSKKNSADC